MGSLFCYADPEYWYGLILETSRVLTLNIDRQKLIAHLEFKADLLQFKIAGYAEIEEHEIVLMCFAKKIVLTQLLIDLNEGKFNTDII